MLSKRGPVTIQYDKNGLAVKKLDYTIKLVSISQTPHLPTSIYRGC